VKNLSVKSIALGGIVAALYVVLTLLSSAIGLSSGVIQVRFSEALCLLPILFPSAIPGLFIGCLFANLLTGAIIWDVIFGSLATLLGAIGTRLLRKSRWLAALPPIIANTIIVPFVLTYAYHLNEGFWFMALTICAGEFISCGILGELLFSALKKQIHLFR